MHHPNTTHLAIDRRETLVRGQGAQSFQRGHAGEWIHRASDQGGDRGDRGALGQRRTKPYVCKEKMDIRTLYFLSTTSLGMNV